MPDAPGARPRAERVETLVMGGGQAGLAVGYHLAQRDLPFLIVDANERIGDSWRKAVGLAPALHARRYNALPGMAFPGPAHSFSTKNEIADYLGLYAARFELPIRTGVRSSPVEKRQPFRGRGRRPALRTQNVVVARASYQAPRVPDFSARARRGHRPAPFRRVPQPVAAPGGTRACRRSRELRGRDRDRGGQGAPDLARREETGHVPFRIEGVPARFVLLPLLFRFIGHRVLTVRTPIGRGMRPRLLSHGAPLVRVKPKDIAAAGVERVPRVVGVRDGLPLIEDDRVLEAANVIWCTGFRRTSPGSTCPSSARRITRWSRSIRRSCSGTRAVLRRALLPLRDVVRVPSRRREGRGARRRRSPRSSVTPKRPLKPIPRRP